MLSNDVLINNTVIRLLWLFLAVKLLAIPVANTQYPLKCYDKHLRDKKETK